MRCWRSLVGKESRASSLFILLPFPESGSFLQVLNIPVKFSLWEVCTYSFALPPDWHLLLTFTLFFHCLCSSVPSENLCGKWTRMSSLWTEHPEFQVLCRALGKYKVPVWMHPGPLPYHWEGTPGQKIFISLKKLNSALALTLWLLYSVPLSRYEYLLSKAEVLPFLNLCCLVPTENFLSTFL